MIIVGGTFKIDPANLDARLGLAMALADAGRGGIRTIGGRYGLGSKEFTPAMVKAVLDEAGKPEPKNHFTVGITDDVTHLSLPVERTWTEPDDVVQAVFYGLGADGNDGHENNGKTI